MCISRWIEVSNMRTFRIFFAFLLAIGLLASLVGMAHAQRAVTLDRVVAIVNDEAITRSELEQQKRAVTLNLRRQNLPVPNNDALERQVLERFINEKAELQHARENGIRVSDGEVDASLQQLAVDNKMTLAQFREALQKDGQSFIKFREEVRNDITLKRLRDREIEQRVVVTEGEIDAYLANAKTQGLDKEEYNLSHVLVLVPEQANPAQIAEREARAKQALTDLSNGRTFGQVAAIYSDASDAAAGGVIGWRNGDRLPTVFTNAVKSMKPGDVSAVLRSPNGFHLVRLNDKRGGTAKTIVEQSKARHILIRVNEFVSEADAKLKLERLRDRISRGEPFSEVAKSGSEDASNGRGGDLGWLSPGDTVPQFEEAMKKLKLNVLSEPTRTQFGWHLIEVMERRSHDITDDRSRASARAALRERKAEESYQDWLRQLRDRSFVELKTED
jgi:peptidyl-prolyl cis-trans isomerase SurA